MTYPVNAYGPLPAYPGYAPVLPAPGGIPLYQAPVLGQDTYQRSYPQPSYSPMASYAQPSYPIPAQTSGMGVLGRFSSLVAALMGLFRRPQTPVPQPVPAAPNPYANVFLPDRSQRSDEDFVADLYLNLLGRQPDPEGFQAHLDGLRRGMDRHELYRIFMESDEYRSRQLGQGDLPQPVPVPLPVPTPPLEPVTVDLVKSLAREYVSQHPEIAERPSYEDTAAVAQLRDGVIAMLQARGYKAGRILGPDGQPYPQMIAFGNPGDPMAKAYRVTAGGGPIRLAVEPGYCDPDIPWGDVH